MQNSGVTPNQSVRFGPFQLERGRRELSRYGAQVKLGSRALDLLVALVDRAGEVVNRDELVALVWPTTVVEDSSLRVQLRALRKALNDDGSGVTYIVNVSGRGYSFVAPVTLVAQPVERSARGTELSLPVNNLPVRLTRIIGRDDLIRALVQQQQQRRFVTIVGHGGAGKTTVAIAVARQLVDAYEHGVLFVDLSPLTQPRHVASAIGSALGISITSDDAMQVLGASLAQCHLLIVLDNCEHVAESAANIAEDLLKRVPGLGILVTSREPLAAEGEWVHPLGALPAPPAQAELSAASAIVFPALELFVERAKASIDTFELKDTDVAVVAALCRRLDGIPLAIEFVAARVGQLGIRGIADRIEDLLAFPANGRRTAVPRHRTLRALVEWSYRLLDDDEQTVLARLSVFSTPFTLARAVAVVADEGLPAQRVVQCALALVGKSLLTTDSDGRIQQYRLLEITRVFAVECLHATSGYDDTCARHARLMIDVMHASHRDWEETPTALWMATYMGTLSDVRAAIAWAYSAHGDALLGIELTRLVLMSVQFPLLDEVRALAQQSLSSISKGSTIDAPRKARIEAQLLNILRMTNGRAPETQPEYSEQFEKAERDGDTTEQVASLYELWSSQFGGGNYLAAVKTAERARAIALRARDYKAGLHSDRMRAQTLHFMGEHAVASELAQRVLANAHVKLPLRYSSWVDRRVSMRIIIARILWMRGFADQATMVAQEAVQIASTDHVISLCMAISFAACPIALWRGDHVEALALADRLDAHAQKHALTHWRDWSAQFQHALRRVTEASHAGTAARVAFNNRPLDVMQRDILATFSDAYVTDEVFERVDSGLVGWCGPEILRRVGERCPAKTPMEAARADSMLNRSLQMALGQGALGWALRSAMSLARLRAEHGAVAEARTVLSSVYDRITEGFETADMCAAKALLASMSANTQDAATSSTSADSKGRA